MKIVQAILRKHLPCDVAVWVFGSRAKGLAKKFSDLDLMLEPKHKIDRAILSDIKEDFEYSVLPYRVDVVLMDDLTEDFKKIIESEKVTLSIRELDVW
ncbi:MAG: nucleotidyltransferase domain-containing protein [Gammaproteobacteria bacterium]|nr:nucleotidyltransferase domain-containing protein [Gammaproteobacteria bacterium]